MRDVFVAGAVRTAIGKLGGTLSSVPVVTLGATVLKAAVERAGVEADVLDEVIMGQVIQAGTGPNPARQAVLEAGFPISLPAYTVNKVCASGMKAVGLGYLSVASGEQNVVAVGGMENMSQAPYVLQQARSGYRLGDGVMKDTILRDALEDPVLSCHMGTTAETLAEEFGMGRVAQDAFAVRSQKRTGDAIASGRFDAEITPVTIPQRRGEPVVFDRDEFPRADTTAEALAKLRPAFQADGTVTAGNASGINDGAAAMVLCTADEATLQKVKPMARIVAVASSALDPGRMGMGPVGATLRVLDKAGLALSDIGIVELNEAFASQSLAVIQELNLDPEIVNVNGGAIALGHPVGASGARILVTLLHVLQDRDLQFGLATLCVGGGQGMAVIVERV
ncbi:MAG: acetyl-CoA C-acetyltransferase [Candidatus Latescibacteria bacterium]|jgi:acetyl-CoA C-acetyltransferase|nr:acetyl-CoA C-acetyltransferase [Candidatus Latescibacterota bacterium]